MTHFNTEKQVFFCSKCDAKFVKKIGLIRHSDKKKCIQRNNCSRNVVIDVDQDFEQELADEIQRKSSTQIVRTEHEELQDKIRKM